jgi:hypothetical protein
MTLAMRDESASTVDFYERFGLLARVAFSLRHARLYGQVKNEVP